MAGKGLWLNVGTIAAAFGASLCCILPVAVALLGVGSAALAASFEPLRPYFVAVTVLLLGFALFQAYKPAEAECMPGQHCALPKNVQRQRLLLWIVAVVAMALITFPYYVSWIF